jgi:probable phosphoglycerate mutase
VAVVCHGGVINAFAGEVLGIREPFLFFDPGYTSISRFLAAKSGERSVLSLNETGHLRG